MRTSRLFQIPTWLLVTFTCGAVAVAAAPNPDPRDAEARRKCENGDALAGVALLAQIYVETLNPNLVYRQARCYQRAGRDENAIERYREYLRRTREMPAKSREAIESRIRDLETGRRPEAAASHDPTAGDAGDAAPFTPATAAPAPVAADAPRPASTSTLLAAAPTPPAAAAPTPPATAASTPPAVASTPPAAAPRAVAALSPKGSTAHGGAPLTAAAPARRSARAPASEETPSQSWQRLTSLLLASGAGAALGTAITFHIAREDSSRQYSRDCLPLKLGACDQLERRVQSAQTGALIGYFAAVSLIGASTYLFLSAPENHEPPSSQPRTLAAVTCGPWSALDGVACSARF